MHQKPLGGRVPPGPGSYAYVDCEAVSTLATIVAGNGDNLSPNLAKTANSATVTENGDFW